MLIGVIEVPGRHMAEVTATDIQTRLIDLTSRSLERFCEKTTQAYGTAVECAFENAAVQKASWLQKQLRELAAISTIDSKGVIPGQFKLTFDRKGLFSLAGLILMLPERQVAAMINRGELRDSRDSAGAITEAASLIAQTFEEEVDEVMGNEGKFARVNTAICDPQTEGQKELGMDPNEEAFCIRHSMIISSHGPFTTMVVFPISMLNKEDIPAEAAAEDVSNEEVASESTDTSPETANEEGPTAAEAEVATEPAEETGAKPAAEETFEPIATVAPEDARYAADIMQRRMLWVGEEDTVGSVLKQMATAGIGYALVGSNGKPSGILSGHDLAAAVSPYLKPVLSQWRRPQDDATLDVKVKWVMSSPVQTVGPDVTIESVAAVIVGSEIGCVPVVGSDGNVEGIITRNGLLRLLQDRRSSGSSGQSKN